LHERSFGRNVAETDSIERSSAMGGFIFRHRFNVFLALVFAVASTAAVFSVMAYAASRHTDAASLSNVKISKFDAADNYIPNGSPVCGNGSYFDIPGMTKTFKLGGTGSRPVTVTYSGGVAADSTDRATFRLLVDGTQEGAGIWAISGPLSELTGFTALTPPLSPGNHTVEIQFLGAAGFCVLGPQTLVILHS
jgi:hypothetical protein